MAKPNSEHEREVVIHTVGLISGMTRRPITKFTDAGEAGHVLFAMQKVYGRSVLLLTSDDHVFLAMNLDEKLALLTEALVSTDVDRENAISTLRDKLYDLQEKTFPMMVELAEACQMAYRAGRRSHD